MNQSLYLYVFVVLFGSNGGNTKTCTFSLDLDSQSAFVSFLRFSGTFNNVFTFVKDHHPVFWNVHVSNLSDGVSRGI